MNDEMRELLRKAEIVMREAAKTEPIVGRAAAVAREHKLSVAETALLTMPFLLNDIGRLRQMLLKQQSLASPPVLIMNKKDLIKS